MLWHLASNSLYLLTSIKKPARESNTLHNRILNIVNVNPKMRSKTDYWEGSKNFDKG